jgi:ferrochelatase
VAKAGVPQGKFSIAFQSRLGRDPWMQPYADKEIERLAHAGVKRLLVICPAFVSDCLETIEEIGMRGRDTFTSAGGEKLTLIPCLNEHPAWLHALQSMVTQRWPEAAVRRIEGREQARQSEVVA